MSKKLVQIAKKNAAKCRMSYTITNNDNINIIINSKAFSIAPDHVNYTRIKAALRRKDCPKVLSLIDIVAAINKAGKGKVVVKDGKVFYNNKISHNYVAKKILEMKRKGFAIDHMIRFMENLMQNPNEAVKTDLLQFMEYGKLPICSDGTFLCYKRVRDDFTSFYDSKTDNRVGQSPALKWEQCDCDRNNTCAPSLHACSFSYLPYYCSGQGRVIMVKINPKEVAAIPVDMSQTKLRCRTYTVLEDLGTDGEGNNLSDSLSETPVRTSQGSKFGPKRDSKGRFIKST